VTFARLALIVSALVGLLAGLPAPATFPERGPGMPTRADYFTSDRTLYSSPWFAGQHRIMIGFGCTKAPYYDPDPSCPGGEGSHHGIDIAMPCGTAVFTALPGRLLDASAVATLGPAYGTRAFLIRNEALGIDVVLGHAERLLVAGGSVVHPGEQVALSGHNGAPDGCHLHFEVRPLGTSYNSAINPQKYLRLSPQ
jgi:murein DD-endopeptidase MepM/ murein hydrolase activator NlpD